MNISYTNFHPVDTRKITLYFKKFFSFESQDLKNNTIQENIAKMNIFIVPVFKYFRKYKMWVS